MSLSRLAVLVGTALIGLGLPLPTAVAAPAPTSSREDSPSAVSWLERAALAPERISYHGTQIITAWGPQGSSSAMLGIVHAASQGTEISVVGSSSAPGAKSFVQRAAHGAGPAVDGGPLDLLKSTYQLAYKCCTETIGRVAVLVEALRDDQTLAARFWIDQASGLLLQRQLFSADGRTLVRATVFTELSIDTSEFLGHLPPMAPGDTETVGMGQVGDLRSQGWTCAADLPASLKLYEVHQDSASGSLQFSYSDGLFTVSVFEQRGALDPAAVQGYSAGAIPGVHVRYGMPSYAVWSSGGIVYTVVGDLPSDLMDKVVAAFPHQQPPQLTALERMGTGLARMATWLTPMSALSWKLG
ncbi:MucB/RseB-like sigma(E) regulatory protein [Kribbella amoyensis]|uniref:MucB/RseB-like sigma(E) regulatory protein n=1 Tax=Kribbella amoyensis TaxID=996641 RepID=A0A561B338_9ACTN|nr:sigma-E factor regulatory protein RseB domain-containing protein [Kribbella amoyensis]TWD73254.1 MucB/RseB-like sigma(E) regulatory protein [Kribbella amoyensis]